MIPQAGLRRRRRRHRSRGRAIVFTTDAGVGGRRRFSTTHENERNGVGVSQSRLLRPLLGRIVESGEFEFGFLQFLRRRKIRRKTLLPISENAIGPRSRERRRGTRRRRKCRRRRHRRGGRKRSGTGGGVAVSPVLYRQHPRNLIGGGEMQTEGSQLVAPVVRLDGSAGHRQQAQVGEDAQVASAAGRKMIWGSN